MKQKRKDTWRRIRSVGKWRYIFSACCIFYCLVSIFITLRKLWPDGKFVHFDDFLFKVIILFVIGFFAALIAWNINEKEFKKANEDQGRA
jgi:heme/copper-type cytochrome/quinol oxidase subunit 3